ncbi:DNTP-hexose glycosyl transferase OS=Streptomyces fumanus OX=67302 GN=GCM10018772_37070 PE=4 SV=1 [Streptomyces fumanus]
MKILFIPGNSPYPIFSHTPLATAARNAGHQVFMGGIDWVLPNIASVGLPAVKISPVSMEEVSAFMGAMPEDPAEQLKAVGRVYAEIAVDSLDRLLDLADHWRPDLVVGGGMFYTAPLLADHLGIPSVRLEWDRIDSRAYDPGAEPVLAPVLAELGLDKVPAPTCGWTCARPACGPRTRSPPSSCAGCRATRRSPWSRGCTPRATAPGSTSPPGPGCSAARGCATWHAASASSAPRWSSAPPRPSPPNCARRCPRCAWAGYRWTCSRPPAT